MNDRYVAIPFAIPSDSEGQLSVVWKIFNPNGTGYLDPVDVVKILAPSVQLGEDGTVQRGGKALEAPEIVEMLNKKEGK